MKLILLPLFILLLNGFSFAQCTGDDVRGDALDFDGNDDYVRVLTNPALSTQMTAEAWISPRSFPNTWSLAIAKYYTLGNNGGVFTLGIFTTGKYQFGIRQSNGIEIRLQSVTNASTTPAHIVGVADGTNVKLYVNGIEEASAPYDGTINSSTRSMTIGRMRVEDGFGALDGTLDEVRLWDIGRTADEIRENMHLTLDGCETNLVAYYQMHDGTGSSTLTDKTGNGHNGTLTNMSAATDWVTSTVNVGNDASTNSNSVTNIGVTTGGQNFAAANLSIDFTAHSATEDICVTYENFTPNITTGATGTNIIQNPMWTVNKSTTSSTQTMDMTFTFPVSTLTTSNPCQLNLYNRSMSADGTWTLVGTASTVTATTATFNGITTTGQFMIVENNTIGADIGRGDALDFDGSNDFVNTTYRGILGGNSRTIEAWIKVPNGGGDRPIVYWGTNANGNRWTVLVNSTGALRTHISAGVIRGTTNLKDNEWHHIAVVLENDGTPNIDEVELYVDGVLEVISSVIPNTINTVAGANLRIGEDQLANQFRGEMDELRIWSLARSATEIRENMHLTLGGCETGLAAYYQMNDGTGSSTLTDKTGNGNDGTLTNMDPATDWVASGVNVGNDISSNSNSETITSIPSGTSTQNFTAANLGIRFFQHSAVEDYTVTYQAFTPNVITGATGVNVIQNPVWTVNKSSATATQVVDYNFTFSAGTFTSLDPTKYGLYWRTMNDDGNWTKIATAHSVTTTRAEFGKISLTGQFMIVQESEDLISDVRGNMYQLDDVNDFIRTDNNITINNVFTWELWIKTNAGYVDQNYDGIISFYTPGQLAPRTQFNFNGAGQLRGTDDLVVSGGTNVNDQEWHHVALVVNGTSAFIYVDGRLDGTGTSTITGTHLKQLNFGAERAVALVSGFSLDEVRIWNTARTQEELRENMHITLKGNETGLVSYYQFNNDGAINSVGGVIDATGTSNATTQNMATSAYKASEVAVAGGISDRITIGAGGVYTFPNTGVSIDFGTTTPNGEIVISRLETEKPHGYAAISGDVDNEYFVVNNYGSNSSFSPLNDITFNRMSYISPSDVGLAQAVSPLQLYKRADRAFGATWGSSLGGADNSVAGTNGSIGYNTTNNLTSFSQLVVVNTALNSQLPVELLSFNVERINADRIQLDWKTESETNNEGFYIERMLDLEDAFESIIFVDGKGTTVMTNYYQEADENSYSGISYYRLKQIDFDGSISYSKIKAIAGQQTRSNNDLNIAIFPNPVEGQLNIKFKQLPVGVSGSKIKLTSLNGQILQESKHNIASFKLLTINTISELSAGVYLIRIELDNGETMVHKFIKL